MSESANPHEARFEAVESVLVQLANSQKQLLQAQVIMSDRQDRTTQLLEKVADQLVQQAAHMDRIDEVIARLSEKVDGLAASQSHSDARLDALIAVVDDLVRKNGKGGSKPQ